MAAAQWPMTISTPHAALRSPPPRISAFVFRVLGISLDIRSVWSLDHDPAEAWMTDDLHPLLAFADAAALSRLRRSDLLRASEIELMVVLDGDLFESARPSDSLSGSLARWAWRQTSADEAYYDESRWAASGEDGAIVRVRRKAFLVWQQDA